MAVLVPAPVFIAEPGFDDAALSRIQGRVKQGVEFFEARTRRWRAIIIKKSTMTPAEKQKTIHAPFDGAPKRKFRPRVLDEYSSNDCVLSRFTDQTPYMALLTLGINRQRAEELGLYFKEANPHRREEILLEYKILSELWNKEVFQGMETKPIPTN
ncbi:MAG: hypothetical protein KGI41_03235 [Patescibacteria group bacterium]|nr:hypothetical protein [Patescibacteria group bacterium]